MYVLLKLSKLVALPIYAEANDWSGHYRPINGARSSLHHVSISMAANAECLGSVCQNNKERLRPFCLLNHHANAFIDGVSQLTMHFTEIELALISILSLETSNPAIMFTPRKRGSSTKFASPSKKVPLYGLFKDGIWLCKSVAQSVRPISYTH